MPRTKSAAAAAAADAVAFTGPPAAEMVRVDMIAASPTNPRKTFDAGELQELVDSISKIGVLQPILVRPQVSSGKAGFELVCGERRWRAAAAARLTEIPAVVRTLSDLEVLEIQVAENLQRVDVPPLEEAAGYQALIEQHCYNVADIADRIGKSESYIRQRLVLTKLHPDAQQYLRDGLLTPSTAILVARLPSPTDQVEAAKAIVAGPLGQPLSLTAARNLIRDRFMRSLADAPFPVDDATLAPAAGPCTACPKRSGAQPGLFGDLQDNDRCLDGLCWSGKARLQLERRLEQHPGPVVRERDYERPEDAPEDWKPTVEHPCSFAWVEADHRCVYDTHGQRTWREVIGDRLPVTLVEVHTPEDNFDGRTEERYLRAEAMRVLRELGIVEAPAATGEQPVRQRQEFGPTPWPQEAWQKALEDLVAAADRIDGRLLLVGLLRDWLEYSELPDVACRALLPGDEDYTTTDVEAAVGTADALTLTRVALLTLLDPEDGPWASPPHHLREWIVQLAEAMQVHVADELREFAKPDDERGADE
jgi:ParB/RepB/Spo0J family partition protein